jgi:hypothetical protein
MAERLKASQSETISYVLNTLCKSISFEKGEEPDWSKFEEIFKKDARIYHVKSDSTKK